MEMTSTQQNKNTSLNFESSDDLRVAKALRTRMVGLRLRYLRQIFGYTQSYVADSLGINSLTYSGYERGVSEPYLELLVRFADFYNVSLDYLFCRVDFLSPPVVDYSELSVQLDLLSSKIDSFKCLVDYMQKAGD